MLARTTRLRVGPRRLKNKSAPTTSLATGSKVARCLVSLYALSPGGGDGTVNDINMVLDIPVQLSVELGRTKVPIKYILQLAQGSVVEARCPRG